MNRVCFITSGPIEWASARMRAHWVARYMRDAVVVQANAEHIYPEARAYVWQKVAHRETIQAQIKAGARVWWDVCDPSWWMEPRQCREIDDLVHGVVASSHALAEDYTVWSKWNRAVCIPDRLELAHFDCARIHGEHSPVRLIWYGLGANRLALWNCLINLERLVANGHKIELTVMDERPEDAVSAPTYPVYSMRWILEHEVEAIAAHDIALLPPYPGPWGRVKSNNKTLTAWACGVPATTGEDYASLEGLVMSHELRAALGRAGQNEVRTNWTVDKSAAEWEALLHV